MAIDDEDAPTTIEDAMAAVVTPSAGCLSNDQVIVDDDDVDNDNDAFAAS
jgi:hypothetical protein